MPRSAIHPGEIIAEELTELGVTCEFRFNPARDSDLMSATIPK